MPVLGEPKWEKACQLHAKGVSKTEAYHQAGFSRNGKTASQFFVRPLIAARVKELMDAAYAAEREGAKKAAENVGLSKKWVLDRLMYNVERCLRGQPVLDANGVQTGKFSGKPDGNAANQGLKLLGMEIGMFVQRTEVGAPGDFERMDLDELEREAEKMRNMLWPNQTHPGVADQRAN